MQILELQIKNFGKFSNKTIRFHEGINILYGKNEAGKSTIHSFIRAMLFGLEKQRGRAAKSDEYCLREPWENPGYFAGVMRMESGGKIFRLERNFDRQRKSATLVCETDGEELSIENGDLQMLLEGLNESAFCNTFFISQKGSATEEGLAGELKSYMNNLEQAGDSEIDVTKAIASLQLKKRQIEAKKKKIQEEQSAFERELQMKQNYIQKEIEKLCTEEEENLHTGKELVRKQEECCKDQKQESVKGKKGRNLLVSLLVVGMILLCVLYPKIGIELSGYLIGVILLVWFGSMLDDWRQRKKAAAEEETEDIQEWQNIQQEIEKCRWKLERIRGDLREKRTICENLRESIEEAQGKEEKDLLQETEALNLAIETMQKVSKEMYQQWGKRLNSRASQILTEITQGKYTSIVMDDSLNIRINTPEKLLELWQVSRGTMEQIYFAVRMAAGELLTEGEAVPVILDEAFAMYDEERLEQMLAWLQNSKKQVLLFTCHRREQEILEKIQNGE